MLYLCHYYFLKFNFITGYLNKFTVESLSKEAGFSSKSTFNVAFKKVNLCTPSEYIALYAAQS